MDEKVDEQIGKPQVKHVDNVVPCPFNCNSIKCRAYKATVNAEGPIDLTFQGVVKVMDNILEKTRVAAQKYKQVLADQEAKEKDDRIRKEKMKRTPAK